MERAFIYDREINKEISGLSLIKPSKGRSGNKLAATLILTSLVDVFSILVIYLLVTSMNQPHELNLDDIDLPIASSSVVLDGGTIVKVTHQGILIDEQPVSEAALDEFFEMRVAGLREEQGEEAKLAIVIQADKSADYSLVDPIILKATSAGFSRLRFAVVQEEI